MYILDSLVYLALLCSYISFTNKKNINKRQIIGLIGRYVTFFCLVWIHLLAKIVPFYDWRVCIKLLESLNEDKRKKYEFR